MRLQDMDSLQRRAALASVLTEVLLVCSNSKGVTGGHTSSIMCMRPAPLANLVVCSRSTFCGRIQLAPYCVVSSQQVFDMAPSSEVGQQQCRFLQGQRDAWAQGGEVAHHGAALRGRHPLHVVQHCDWLEIRARLPPPPAVLNALAVCQRSGD